MNLADNQIWESEIYVVKVERLEKSFNLGVNSALVP